DIDGVITDETHPNNNVWHNALCEFLGYNIKRIKESYYFDEAYGLSREIITSFLLKYRTKIYSQAKIYEGAKDTLNYLNTKGFQIHLITAREPEHRQLTADWLKKYGIKYTALYHEDNKTPLAVKKGIELFIEDNAENALKLSRENITVLLMNKYHNQGFKENTNIIRVNDWSDIRKEIFNFYSQSIPG
ncbi:MAG: hypothetical protein GX175_02670, partial [Halanaerobiaceae bacterium]|nr:hypothetical protein [Halanaerobiaceae bacterium]